MPFWLWSVHFGSFCSFFFNLLSHCWWLVTYWDRLIILAPQIFDKKRYFFQLRKVFVWIGGIRIHRTSFFAVYLRNCICSILTKSFTQFGHGSARNSTEIATSFSPLKISILLICQFCYSILKVLKNQKILSWWNLRVASLCSTIYLALALKSWLWKISSKSCAG